MDNKLLINVAVIARYTQEITIVQSSSTRSFCCLISMQIANSWPVQCSDPAIHHYHHIFPKCHVDEGGGGKKAKVLFIFEKGKSFLISRGTMGVSK